MEQALSSQEFFTKCTTASWGDEGRVRCFQPPLEGCYKPNADGALFFDIQEAEIYSIVRDCKGEVIMAASLKEQEVQQPKVIKILAFYRGIQLCLQLDISNIIMNLTVQWW